MFIIRLRIIEEEYRKYNKHSSRQTVNRSNVKSNEKWIILALPLLAPVSSSLSTTVFGLDRALGEIQ